MAELTVDQVAEAMFRLVSEATGLRKLRPTDLSKAMIEQFGRDRCSRDLCKEALRTLIDSGRCIYTFYSGSFVELPPSEPV